MIRDIKQITISRDEQATYQNRIYLEVGDLFEWNKCDELEKQRFQVYMENLKLECYVIDRKTAEQWVKQA